MKSVRVLRASVILILLGLLLELVAVVALTPLTFMLFVGLGVPSLLLGVGLYVVRVLGMLRQKDAL
jgi:hypothetical protein